MASTEAEICNLALLRIGHREPIGSLVETSTESQTCAIIYPLARDAVLAAFPWKFATRRAVLAVVTAGEQTGWDLAYSLPADCLVPRYIYSGLRTPAATERVPWVLEADATHVQYLMSDQADAELVYTSKVTAVPRFPPLFVQALAWCIASDLALSMRAEPQVGLAMMQAYNRALAQAMAAELNKGQGDQVPDSEFITER